MDNIITSMLSMATYGGHDRRVEEAIQNQLFEALCVLRSAKKPLKFNKIAESFSLAIFRGVEEMLANSPGVKRTVFKNKAYYQLV